MKLLVSDYDNTYQIHHDVENKEDIFLNNYESLDKFMKTNLFCISTGRSFPAIYKTIIEKKLKFNYLSANNGAELYDDKLNLIYVKELNQEAINIISKLDEFIEVFYRKAFNTDKIVSVNIYFNDIEKFDIVKNYLKENLLNCYIEFKYPKMKILNGESNKKDVIKLIANANNILDENIITIGDELNDLNMIQEYNGYTLNNANPKLLKLVNKKVENLSDLVNKYI